MKRICMLLSMVMLLTSIIATPHATVFADETIARADFFDTDANLGLYNQTQTSASVSNSNDAERGNVFFVDTAKSTQSSMGIGKSISKNGINTGKVILGADVKMDTDAAPRFGLRFTTKNDAGAEKAHMLAWIGISKKALLTRGDGGEAGLGSQYDTGTKPGTEEKAAAAVEKPIETDKWTRVEVIVDFDNQSRSLYVDGELVEKRSKNDDSSLFTSIYNEKIVAAVLTARNNVAEGDNKKDDLYFTNVRAAQIPSETTVKSSISGNDIYLWYNTAAKENISDLTAADVEVQNVENRENKLAVSSVTPMGQSGVKVSLSDLDSAAAGEYRVVINKEIHDIFGNDMSKVLFYNKKTVALMQINNSYDDNNIGTTVTTDFEIITDPNNANNKVLKMPSKIDANGEKTLDIPAVTENTLDNRGIVGTTYHYSMRVNKLQNDKSYWSFMPFFPKDGSGWSNPCGTMWFFRNVDNDKYSLLFGTKTKFAEEWNEQVKLSMDWKASTWYDVDVMWKYGAIGETPSVTYKITETATGAVLYEGTYNTPAMNTLKEMTGADAVKFLGVRLINFNMSGAITDGKDHSVLIDDLKVEMLKPINAVKSVRFVDVNGTKYAPDATLPNDITKIEITADGSGVTQSSFDGKIKLNNDVKSGTFNADTNTYTIDLGGILAPTTAYTLSIDEMTDVNIPAYSTSFTTSEGSFKITDIKIVDESGNAIALANVTKDTKLKVVVEGINTTGGEKSAVVSYGIYNDKMLTGFDFAPVTFESTGVKTTKELNVGTITDVNNLSIKGFVWDSMKVMTPQSDFAELK